MRKMITTSASFVGEVHITYDHNDRLSIIDFTRAELNDKQVQWLKDKIPLFIDKYFVDHFAGAKLEFVPAEYTISFDEFWIEYDKKVHPGLCRPIWDKLPKTDQVKAHLGIAIYDRYLQKTGYNKADPKTYLRHKYWLTDWGNVKR